MAWRSSASTFVCAELRTMIEQARPLIQAHLRRAHEVLDELGGTV